MLKIPIYIGLIARRKVCHPGQHPAIIDLELWKRVQEQFAAHIQGPRVAAAAKAPGSPRRAGTDERGEALVFTHACKGSRHYPDYVSRSLRPASEEIKGNGVHVPAREIEPAVIERLTRALADPIRLLCCQRRYAHCRLPTASVPRPDH